MIPSLLLFMMAPAQSSAVPTTDPKYCLRNEVCYIISYDPNQNGAQAQADTDCRKTSFDAAKKNPKKDVRCTPVALQSKGDEFNASAPKDTKPSSTPQPGNQQPGKPQVSPSGNSSSGPLRGGTQTNIPVPTNSRGIGRNQTPQPQTPPYANLPLGPVLKAAVDKGDCRISDYQIQCPGFLPDVPKDRLDRDPKHDGTFEDSPIKLYGAATTGNDPKEHPERFTLSTTLCDARDLAAEIFKNYDTKNPIRIVKLRGADRKDTYLILLSGTEPVNVKQATGILTDMRLGVGLPIRYSNELYAAAKSLIPQGSRVILAGHSLGGMVAEKAASDPAWQRLFRTTDVITYGSPQVGGADVVGTRYTRFWNVGDHVPSLSLEPVVRKEKYKYVDGPTGVDLIGFDAHMFYPNNQQLTKYDALGQLGNACLSLDAAETWRFQVRMDGKLR